MRIENGISAQLCHLLVKEEQDVRRIYRKKNIVIVVTRQNLSYLHQSDDYLRFENDMD